ncbi:hypothetical protein CRE_13459 [Caenorhabditis remanei]|uniref:Uncharacterized protein n=1 Tax=Caenorhabditis remanei TaxID=31234 RepID=E3MR33_CAERE|nr:hypothetical protein CRE_13459 [Caenorhabditis remanei]
MSDQSSSGSSSAPPPSYQDLELMSMGPAHAVVPLSECPHLDQVQPLPLTGIDASTNCSDCRLGAEIWTGLTCYQSDVYTRSIDRFCNPLDTKYHHHSQPFGSKSMKSHSGDRGDDNPM